MYVVSSGTEKLTKIKLHCELYNLGGYFRSCSDKLDRFTILQNCIIRTFVNYWWSYLRIFWYFCLIFVVKLPYYFSIFYLFCINKVTLFFGKFGGNSPFKLCNLCFFSKWSLKMSIHFYFPFVPPPQSVLLHPWKY